jgi:hypothetical protein
MADPAWTDAVRDDLHKDLGLGLGWGGLAHALDKLFHPQNAKYLLDTTDENAEAHLSGWRITACKIGLDTDANGYTYFRYDDNTPSGGNATLNVYCDATRLTLVATGTVADGGTLTLVPQTGYTFAATVRTTAATVDFDFRGMVIEPAYKALRRLFDDTGIDDGQLYDAGVACALGMRSDFAAARAKAEGFAELVATVKARRLLSSLTDAQAMAVEGLKGSTVSKGTVDWRPSGLLIDLKLGQHDNTSGSGEIKAGAGAWSGTPSYTSWTGKTTTAPNYGQRTQAALLTYACKKTLTGTPPEFQVTRRTTDTRLAPADGTASEVASFPLSVGQTWREPAWGIESMLIDYAPTATNEGGGTAISATSTDWSVTGLKSTLSDSGKLWGIYNAGVFEFYSSEDARNARDANYLICQKTFSSTSAAFTTETTTTGITVSGKSGGTLTSGHKFTVDFNVPSPNSPVSIFTLTIVETTRASRWVQRMRDGGFGGQSWEPNTGGSPNLQDGWIDAGIPLVHAGVQGDKV